MGIRYNLNLLRSNPEYNTVMSTIRLQTTDGDTRIRSDWAGMAFTGLFDGNYGFAMAQTSQIPACKVPSLTAWSEDNPVPEEIYIHEWLHCPDARQYFFEARNGFFDSNGNVLVKKSKMFTAIR